MREIKFRAWDKRENNWADYPIYIDDNGDIYWEHYEIGLQEAGDLIVMQYTGLKDQKGVEIFEGDIVDYLGVLGIVGFALNNQQTMISSYSDSWIADVDYSTVINMAVIGNIYENSDLI